MVEEKGFAIRCPHCQKWNVWKKQPKEFVADEAKFDEILKGLGRASEEGHPWDYSDDKLLRCTRPRWSCPTSFEAVIFKSREEAKKCLAKIPDAWPLKRDFRLYKADCKRRWLRKYYAILFCTPPFARAKSIRLEELMDRELLSRLIVGISVEMNLPVTIYAANVFKNPERGPETYWMPIDAYSMGEQIVPPRFNEFCRTCRKLVIEKLKQEFKDGKVSVSKCPIRFGKNKKCAGREPACMQEPKDWNHCPAFIIERKKRDPCYQCDVKLIKKIQRRWRKGETMKNGLSHKCWAGFKDMAFPIIVHEHLLGVAGTGQVFYDEAQIRDVGVLVKKWKIFEGCENSLRRAKRQLFNEEKRYAIRDEATFLLFDRRQLNRIKKILRLKVDSITDMANARYCDIRRRSENMFREEILSYIQSKRTESTFFGDPLLQILKRMREFWAFKAVYLASYSYKSREVSVIGMSSMLKKEKSFGLPGKRIGRKKVLYRQTHPIDFVYRRRRSSRESDPLMETLINVFTRAMAIPAFSIPKGKLYFFVVVPFMVWEEVYFFVFSARDVSQVSELESQMHGNISQLCQEIMLRVCTEVVYEFADVRAFVEQREQAREQAWREFSALAAHRIGNEISAADMLVYTLVQELMEDPEWVKKWGDRLPIIQERIKKSKRMLIEKASLTAEIKPQLQPTNLRHLIEKGALGILPDKAILDFKDSGEIVIVNVDLVRMEEVFRELCVNAVQAASEKARIEVEIRQEKNRLYIYFRDNGPGIKPEDKERIFKSYVSLGGKGTGLGLTTVRRIIEAHKGSIAVSEVPVGAEFIIKLPLKRSVT